MRFLLDTNILSDLVRNPQGKTANRIASVGENNVCTSIVAAAELRYGARKKNSVRLMRQVEAILSVIEIAPLEPPADAFYAKIRTTLESAGWPIGGNDLLIAGQALAMGLTLVTDNEREFDRVEGLKVENWFK
jgi:tRNA(fMet)-specific endonuclease VapC